MIIQFKLSGRKSATINGRTVSIKYAFNCLSYIPYSLWHIERIENIETYTTNLL